MQRIIITGGSGLIGRALTTELTAHGYEVVILSRRPEAATALPAGARVIGWDGRSAQGWGELADGAYAIVNLAGASIARPPWTEMYKRAIVESRVNAGHAVVEAVKAAAQKPSVVVQASAVGIYGVRKPRPSAKPRRRAVTIWHRSASSGKPRRLRSKRLVCVALSSAPGWC